MRGHRAGCASRAENLRRPARFNTLFSRTDRTSDMKQRVWAKVGWGVVGLLVGLSACKTAEPPAVPGRAAEKSPGYLVGGYHPWWMQEVWRTYPYDVLDVLYFFEVEVGRDGTLRNRNGWPDRWVEMRRAVQQHGTRVVPVVTLFDREAFEALFGTPEAARPLLENLVGLVRDSPGIGGLQIDFEIFEPVKPGVRAHYTAFVQALRAALDDVRPRPMLSLFALALDEHDVYDETALARYVDYFVVQGYDFHARGDATAGPVAPLKGWGRLNWQAVTDRFLELGVPREKIVMAVPYYGYEWPTVDETVGARTRGAGVTLTYAPVDTLLLPEGYRSARQEALRHGRRRDPASGSPYYVYADSTGWRQGWFEDAASLREKYAFVRQAGLRGIAVFPLAYGDATLDAALREAFPTP